MATTSDKGVLTRKLGASDYNPTRYVAEISQRCVGEFRVLTYKFIDYCLIVYASI